MIQTELVHSQPTATVLAAVLITQEDIPAVKLNGIPRQAVVTQQTDDSWNLDFEIEGPNPIPVQSFTHGSPQQAGFKPIIKTVGVVNATFDGDDFCRAFVQKAEGAGHREYVDRHVMAIQCQHAGLDRRIMGCNHFGRTPLPQKGNLKRLIKL
jgi:hypothetical protein